MAKTGLVICSNPVRLLRIFTQVKCDVKNTLYVHFFPNPASDKKALRNRYTMIDAYTNLSSTNVDVRILLYGLKGKFDYQIATRQPVDVIFYDNFVQSDQLDKIVSSLSNMSPGCKIVFVPSNVSSVDISESSKYDKLENEFYTNVVLGGSFDRLHNGHKILLSTAALVCDKKLTVGVTDNSMLKSKKLWELVEPCAKRLNKVKEFLQDIDSTLEYNIFPIYDIYGPTIHDPTFEMIVVSEETIKGGESINEKRISNGLKPLVILPLPLLKEHKLNIDFCEEEDDKISSSNYRMRLLGSLLKPPTPKNNIGLHPYIIGLTGGIASGKSSIANYLKELGAFIINADLVAHTIYDINGPAYEKLIDTFGPTILTDNKQINRKHLGEIVFSNKKLLNKLNEIMWPLVLQKVKTTIESTKDHNIIVLEAAILIKANWHFHCHEIWVTIIPPEEAVKRLRNRNNLSEKESLDRISSQPSNCEYIAYGNVVFSTLWSHNCTRIQINRAWNSLLKRVSEIQ